VIGGSSSRGRRNGVDPAVPLSSKIESASVEVDLLFEFEEDVCKKFKGKK
jgi:hypothetical protein